MFYKWFSQDVGKVLDQRNRGVVVAESTRLDLLASLQLPYGLEYEVATQIILSSFLQAL
jgi:hypothetical protein